MEQQHHPLLALDHLEAARARLASHIRVTPTWEWSPDLLQERARAPASVVFKLELFQHTGTFKVRASLNAMLMMDEDQRRRGVTAVSAGNHAVATAWAAARLGIDAKILMPKTANPFRVELTRSSGADIIFADSHHAMFEMVREIEADEGRTFIHPFEGPACVQGNATCGLEFVEQTAPVDVMVLPVGGGGLCTGFAAALRHFWPQVTIYGVEPAGADSMSQSFRSGKAEKLSAMNTIADSLAPPQAEPWTFARCRELVDDIVTVTDSEMRAAMRVLFSEMKLAVEPAGAAATAGMLGPLRTRCEGKRVGIMVCGSNIDAGSYTRLLRQDD